MVGSSHAAVCEYVFRPHRRLTVIKVGMLLVVCGGVAGAAVVHDAASALLVAAVLLFLAARVAYLETAVALVVRGDTLLLQRGLLFQREEPIPLHRAVVITSQGPLARWMDCGDLTITCDDQALTVRAIAEFRHLQACLAHIQRVPDAGRVR